MSDRFWLVLLLVKLEDTARYAGLLLAPTEGFGLRPRLFMPFGQNSKNSKIQKNPKISKNLKNQKKSKKKSKKSKKKIQKVHNGQKIRKSRISQKISKTHFFSKKISDFRGGTLSLTHK